MTVAQKPKTTNEGRRSLGCFFVVSGAFLLLLPVLRQALLSPPPSLVFLSSSLRQLSGAADIQHNNWPLRRPSFRNSAKLEARSTSGSTRTESDLPVLGGASKGTQQVYHATHAVCHQHVVNMDLRQHGSRGGLGLS